MRSFLSIPSASVSENREAGKSLPRLNLAIVLQGLKVGGMERGAIQLAKYAAGLGYHPRYIVYDSAHETSEDQYDPGEVPISFVARRRGVDFTLPSRLAQAFREWHIDIVHAHNNVAGFYSAAAIELMAERPGLVVTFDSYPGKGTAKARLASRWATRRAAAVTSVSQELSKRLVAGGWAWRSETIWNGVNVEEFSATGPLLGLRECWGLDKTSLLVGQVARIDDNKRQTDLIEAARLVRRKLPNVRFLLAGDGPRRGEVERLAAAAGNVHVIRRVVDVAAFLREIDIFVLCSVHEGAPRALLEAMACGKAVVATAVGGVPYILGDCGILVPPERPDLLAAAIQQLCESAERRATLGASARRRVLQSFTMEVERAEYARVYAEVIKKR